MKKHNLISLLGFGIIAIGSIGAARYAVSHLSANSENSKERSSIVQATPAETRSVSSATTPAVQKVDSVEIMAERLRARLEAEPNDMNGWVLLGRSYHFLQRWDDAKAAFAKARELGYQEPDVKLDSPSSAQGSMEADAIDPHRDEAASGSSEIFSDISHASSRLQ